ncbi:MAG: hypothetical protein ABH950_02000 [Candidatus Altiarchaeota archaeon]
MDEKVDRTELVKREAELKKREEKIKKKKEKELEERETEIRKKQLTDMVKKERQSIEGEEEPDEDEILDDEEDSLDKEDDSFDGKDDFGGDDFGDGKGKGEPEELLEERDRLEDLLSELEDRYDQEEISDKEYKILVDTYENMLVEIDVGLKRWKEKK